MSCQNFCNFLRNLQIRLFEKNDLNTTNTAFTEKEEGISLESLVHVFQIPHDFRYELLQTFENSLKPVLDVEFAPRILASSLLFLANRNKFLVYNQTILKNNLNLINPLGCLVSFSYPIKRATSNRVQFFQEISVAPVM